MIIACWNVLTATRCVSIRQTQDTLTPLSTQLSSDRKHNKVQNCAPTLSKIWEPAITSRQPSTAETAENPNPSIPRRSEGIRLRISQKIWNDKKNNTSRQTERHGQKEKKRKTEKYTETSEDRNRDKQTETRKDRARDGDRQRDKSRQIWYVSRIQ